MSSEVATVDVPPMFRSSYAKLGWAGTNLKQLGVGFENYLVNGTKTRIERTDAPGKPNYFVFETAPIDIPVSLIVGDIARNLRDSLDHFISAIYKKHTSKPDDKRHLFPFGEEAHELISRCKETLRKDGLGLVADVIINRINPTKAGNFPLWGLNKLNNADKHRELTTLITFVAVPLADWTIGDFYSSANRYAVRPGQSRRIAIPAGAEITENSEFQLALDVKFGPDEVFPYEEVFPTLSESANAVHWTLNELLEAYIEIYGT